MKLAAVFDELKYMLPSKKLILVFLVPLFFALQCRKNSSGSSTNTEPAGIKDSVIVSGLSHPWEILWGPDQFIWMTERGGRVSRVNPNTGQVLPLITIAEVVSQGEGGLLGMALHPSFSTTPHVFLVYNYLNGGSYREKLVRFSYNGNSLVNPVTIIDNIDAASIHNGSRLLVVNDKLFMSTGDAADQTSPQNISSPNGKILRFNLDGSIPADNPVAGNPYWSYGHRNAQGLVFANNKLYSSEHGPASDDELNIIEKAKNYGWPDVRGFCNENAEQNYCSSHPIIEPLLAWTPTIAACGLDYYGADQIPQWKNSLLLATLKDARLYQLKLDNSFSRVIETNEFFTNEYGRLRDICISPGGKVYICSSNGGNDKIIEVKAAP
ncbi:MAG TPA: PQQ-dependent sugar dehydrogenase [Chitinophagaceae bacterium]|nr:PQQ-dependent sugar dehydrogenase [Chitinophagaceae bacterium]